MSTVIFGLERAIVYAPLGLLAVVFLGFVAGSLIATSLTQLHHRAAIYGLVGCLVSVWDYSRAQSEEFANVPPLGFVSLVISSWAVWFSLSFALLRYKLWKQSKIK